MKLYFLRHADAVAGGDDAGRELSAEGKRDCRTIGRFFKKIHVEFTAVYSSPLLRARQTAELVLKASGADESRIRVTDILLNEISERNFLDWLESLPAMRHVLLVGHAPTLAERVCKLLGLSRPGVLKLSKGALACLDTEDRRTARLRFLVGPKHL